MLQPVGLQRVGHNLATEQQHVIIRHCTGSDWRKKRQLLQCPCLESPRDREPGGQPSMGSLRVGHDCATSLSLFTFMHWRREWQPAPVSVPGESQGQGSLVGCRPWGRTELDTTEATQQQQQQTGNEHTTEILKQDCW